VEPIDRWSGRRELRIAGAYRDRQWITKPSVGPIHAVRSATDPPVDGHPFALCLTHDVDRVRKTYQTLYYALRDRDPSHLRDLVPGAEPYWQFDEVRALEADRRVPALLLLVAEDDGCQT
jgi:hypothetical protein